MKTTNGWDVYLKIKELTVAKDAKHEVRVDDVADEFKSTDKEIIREYLNAFSILNFIEFTDKSKEAFLVIES